MLCLFTLFLDQNLKKLFHSSALIFLIKGNDAKKIPDKELSELAKKKADDSKFSLRIDSKTDINSQT